ncbi:MAG: hypothetical protein GTO02_18100, partial [Candidatus Dadabacteria bacterium]|nr:hypothetical protein [Candidatus Dadabacteria bacterium]NIQ16227.1 hypothetical protein [Candidatus Dadabacteria bacterium]
MKYFKYLVLAFIISIPVNVFAGVINHDILVQQDIEREEELAAYYDLRNRSTYIQVTNVEDENPLCIHVQ